MLKSIKREKKVRRRRIKICLDMIRVKRRDGE
jgi:hypothetical protein